MRNSTKTNFNITDDKKLFFLETIAKFCDKCGSPYKPEDITIVQENGLSTIIHFSCTNCKSNHVANFVLPIGLASRVPVNTDLTSDEIVDFARKDKISVDDVLAIYENLENLESEKKA